MATTPVINKTITSNLSWDNPNGGKSTATIQGTSVTDINIPGEGGSNTVFTLNTATLSHIKDVITDIINFLNQPAQ